MKLRELVIKNKDNSLIPISKNKTIIDYTLQYSKEKQLKTNEIMRNINNIWMHKRLVLPVELVSLCRGKITEWYCENKTQSAIK